MHHELSYLTNVKGQETLENAAIARVQDEMVLMALFGKTLDYQQCVNL